MAKLLVKEICKKRGISLKTLAERMGITPSALSQSLNTNPSIQTLERVALTLGVNLTDLFEQAKPEINGYIQVKDNILSVSSPDDWIVISSLINGIAHPQLFKGGEDHVSAINSFVRSTITSNKNGAMMAWFSSALFSLAYDGQTKRFTLVFCVGNKVYNWVYTVQDFYNRRKGKESYVEDVINEIVSDLEKIFIDKQFGESV